jgi:N-acetylmuramoyl-L-alanine amidase
MLPIQFYPIKFNHNKGRNSPKYIVIHDTGNPNAGALNHWKYFGGGDRQSSAHYFVDNENIIQIIADSDSAWHCGDGKGKYGITNHNSLSIEICLTGNLEKSISNALKLTLHLMAKYGIRAENVVRHYDASRKTCPRSMSGNSWARWTKFKSDLGGSSSGQSKNDEKKSGLFYVQVGAYSEKSNAINMASKLENAGFKAIIKTD